ncbi:hypothetical protein GC197_06090 [bacterium]|nr:hypothetical protein [bacterium]
MRSRSRGFSWKITLGIVLGISVVIAIFGVMIYLESPDNRGSFERTVLEKVTVLGVFGILATLVVLSLVWSIGYRLRSGGLLPNVGTVLRNLRFRTWQAFVVVTVAAVIAGFVRAFYPNESPVILAVITLLGLVLVTPLIVVAYLGIDTLFFGRGSGARINRMREIEAKRKAEDFPVATCSSDHPPHDFPPVGPVPPKVSMPEIRPGRKSDKPNG